MINSEKFFASFDKAGFLKTALWKPSSGAPDQSAQVRYRAPSNDVLGNDANSTDYSVTYPASVLCGLKRGEVLTIDDQQYTVRESPASKLDGTVVEAKLRRGAS